MPKTRKASPDRPPAEDTQKLYARAYGSRLAKQVNEELDSSRRKPALRKKPNSKA